jgi:hypothetical protein
VIRQLQRMVVDFRSGELVVRALYPAGPEHRWGQDIALVGRAPTLRAGRALTQRGS